MPIHTPVKEVRESINDPDNSVSLFDSNRRNQYGEMYCVEPDILVSQVDEFWGIYIKGLENDPHQIIIPKSQRQSPEFLKILDIEFSELYAYEIDVLMESLQAEKNGREQELEHTPTFEAITENVFEDLTDHEIDLITDQLSQVRRGRF